MRIILVSFSALMILCAGASAAIASDEEAVDAAIQVMDTRFVSDKGFYFSANERKREIMQIVIRRSDISVQRAEIHPADKLNGTDWKGTVRIPYSSRTIQNVPPFNSGERWQCWSEGILNVALQRTKQKWSWDRTSNTSLFLPYQKTKIEKLDSYLALGSIECGLANALDTT